jgi:oligopeptide transport system substrate-binding protein
MKRYTGIRVAAILGLAATALIGCSSGSDSSTDTTAVAEAVETTPAETTPAETTPAETTPADTTPAAAETPADGGVFVDLQNFAAGEADHIDPALTSTLTGAQVSVLMFDSLTDTDAAGALVPAAATKWETADQGKTWVFTLDPKGKFSNGDPVKASNFAKAWVRATSKDMASEVAYHSYIIQGFQEWNGGTGPEPTSVVADDAAGTLTVTLTNPFLGFPAIASHPVFSPMTDANAAAPATLETTMDLIGNGPYKLKETPTNKAGGQIALVRNENYGGTPGTLSEIQFKISGDVDTAYNQFESGQGLSAAVPAGRYKEAKDKYGDQGLGVVLGTDYWGLRYDDPVLGGEKNVKLREAIALAIDRAQISDQIYEGQRVPTDQLVPKGIPGYTTGLGLGVERNLDGAKAAFAEWTAAGNKLDKPLRLSYNEGANWDQVATIMQGNLKEAGIDAELNPFPADGTYFTKMREGEGQIIRAGWFADYVLYDNFMFPLLHKASIGGDNLVAYNSDEFSGLVDQARAEADPAKAAELYAQAEKIALSKDIVLIPTVNRANNMVFSPKVKNFASTPLGFVLYQQMTVEG